MYEGDTTTIQIERQKKTKNREQWIFDDARIQTAKKTHCNHIGRQRGSCAAWLSDDDDDDNADGLSDPPAPMIVTGLAGV